MTDLSLMHRLHFNDIQVDFSQSAIHSHQKHKELKSKSFLVSLQVVMPAWRPPTEHTMFAFIVPIGCVSICCSSLLTVLSKIRKHCMLVLKDKCFSRTPARTQTSQTCRLDKASFDASSHLWSFVKEEASAALTQRKNDQPTVVTDRPGFLTEEDASDYTTSAF